jgi:hypothetical protein
MTQNLSEKVYLTIFMAHSISDASRMIIPFLVWRLSMLLLLLITCAECKLNKEKSPITVISIPRATWGSDLAIIAIRI